MTETTQTSTPPTDYRAGDENLAQQLWDADLTIVRILNLPAMLCTERQTDDLTDSFGADPQEALTEILGEDWADDMDEVWFRYRTLYRNGGQPPRWLVLVERQVPFNIRFDEVGEAQSWSVGGLYRQDWLPGVTFDECMTAAVEWSETMLAEEIDAARPTGALSDA